MRLRLVMMVVAVMSSSLTAGPTIGWRGDGTGVWPNADPPTQWQRISKTMLHLRCQAEPLKDGAKPGGVEAGTAMPDGVIREWLILAPIADAPGAKGAAPADAVYAEDQSKLAPETDQSAGGVKWKAIKADNAYIDFARLFDSYGKQAAQAGYAHTYIYSPADGDFIIDVIHTASLFLWVNGKLTHKPKEADLNHSPQFVKLHKGWNQLLLRSAARAVKGDDRPMVGTWYVSVIIHAVPDKAEFDQKNIAWRAPLPSADSLGGPIIVGKKIFLLSEMADLVCLDAATGKILWVRSNNYDELATDAEKKAHEDIFKEIEPLAARLKQVNDSFAGPTPPKLENVQGRDEYKEKVGLEKQLYALMRKVDDKKYLLPKGQDVGYSGVTPASDGKSVWAWFATGVTCRYDLDGKCVWRRLDNEGSFFEHGYSTSPLLADGKLVVFMNKMIAFDAATGERLWTTEFNPKDFWANRFHGTPAAAMIGKTAVCVLPTGQVLRLSDGKIIRDKGPEVSNQQQEIPSPVVMGNMVYELSTYSKLHKVVLPQEASEPLANVAVRTAKIDVNRYPTYYLDWFLASPLIHDGLAYCLNNTGVLVVIDVEKMEVVYQKLLDVDHYQSVNEGAGRGIGISPSLAGRKIYIVGDTGTTLVIKPGRAYEQLAKNKIESVVRRYWSQRTERFISAPVFDGKRMYLRGERYLYCIAND